MFGTTKKPVAVDVREELARRKLLELLHFLG